MFKLGCIGRYGCVIQVSKWLFYCLLHALPALTRQQQSLACMNQPHLILQTHVLIWRSKQFAATAIQPLLLDLSELLRSQDMTGLRMQILSGSRNPQRPDHTRDLNLVWVAHLSCGVSLLFMVIRLRADTLSTADAP